MTVESIKTLLTGKANLSLEQAYDFQRMILNNEIATAELAEIFQLLDAKGKITEDELRGFFKASQEAMVSVNLETDTLDTCGTGGGGENTFNISTAAAIVCAAAGVPVAKHGNRAATSLCGSADVLEALGIKIDLKPDEVPGFLQKHNFAFMFARSYHPAFKFAADARKQFAKRTYFNLLGPLLNPAKAAFRTHGFASGDYIEILGKILIESGVKKAYLFHGSDGLDEISPFVPTDVYEFSAGQGLKKFMINPMEFGFGIGQMGDIRGGESAANAQIIANIFKNRGNPSQTAAVILNAAAGLAVSGKTANFPEGVIIAKEAILSGRAREKLKELQN